MKASFKSSFVPFMFGLAGVVLISLFGHKRIDSESGQPRLIPPQDIKYFSLGYNEVLADSFWLRTIQDFDYCENRPSAEARATDYQCRQGWVFHMIESITELAPRFRQAYYSGAVMLSVIVNDIQGSSVIFDKGVSEFPNDWQLAYAAAYQALIEEHNNKKASELLVRAGKNGAPPWVFALASRLQEREGQLQLAKSTLENALELSPRGPGAERIQKRLDEVNAELTKTSKTH